MKKPRIAFLIPRLGITDRGAEVVVYELASYLSKHFDIAVWVRWDSGKSKLLTDLERKDVEIKRVKCVIENNFLVKLIYRIKILRPFLDKFHLNPTEIEMLSFSLACLPGLLSGNYSLLFPNNGFGGTFVCWLVRMVKKTPFVYASHGGIEPMIAKLKPDCYFALNKTVEDWYKKYFPNLKVVFIPNGVSTERFTSFGEKIKLNLERPVFLTVAAFIPVKRIEMTIKAVAKLKEGSLLLLGDGPLREQLKSLGERLLGKRRFKTLKVKNDQIPKYYRSADIFTLAAQGEPGSLVNLEAMASGLPVVVNNEESLRFVVGEGGLQVDTTDVMAYSSALKKALETNFGDKPRRQAEKFSWEKIAEEYHKSFIKLLR